MSRTGAQLLSAPIDRYRSMGAFGKPVYQSHMQLRGMLQGQRKPQLAHYFATPVYDTETGELQWLTDLEGTPRRLSDLGPHEAKCGTEALHRIREDLTAFVHTLRERGGGQPGSSAAFASLLEQAMRVPAQGDFVYFVGDQPVIAFWGFEDELGRSADPASSSRPAVPAPVDAAPAVDPPTSLAPPVDLPATGDGNVRDRRTRWWWWGLLALLALAAAVLGLRGCQAPSTAADPSGPDTVGRKAELALEIPPGTLERGDLSFLEGQWQLGEDRLDEYQDGQGNVVGSGRNVLEFKRDGTGRGFFLERRRHAKGEPGGSPYPTCSGTITASTDGKVLTIAQNQCVVPGGKGEGIGGSRQECRRTEQGHTLCESVNTNDGVRWSALLRRLGASR